MRVYVRDPVSIDISIYHVPQVYIMTDIGSEHVALIFQGR